MLRSPAEGSRCSCALLSFHLHQPPFNKWKYY
jgi:hypothetical protein